MFCLGKLAVIVLLDEHYILAFKVLFIKDIISSTNRKKGKYTDGGISWELAYREVYQSKAEAQKREKEIKARKSRAYIEELVGS